MHREDLLFCVPSVEGLGLFDGIEPHACWPNKEPEIARKGLLDAFATKDTWDVSTVFHTMNDALPDGMTVSVDSGAHRILWSQIMTCTRSNQLMQSTGLCTMGCALPLAIGYSLANDHAPALAVMGDGCLDMVLGELATLRDLSVPVTVLVVVDGSYSLIAQKQNSEGYQATGVDFGITDYAGMATAMGINAITATDATMLADAVEKTASRTGPSLIAIPMPRGAYSGLI